MVDRNARDRMIAAIRAYMAGATTDKQFDDEICRIETEDETVTLLVFSLECDFPTGRKLAAAKPQWDSFNRILLLIESDAELADGNWRRRAAAIQIGAAVSLIAYVALLVHMGFDEGSYGLLMLPFGIVTALLLLFDRLTDRRENPRRDLERYIDPFPSIASILRVRRRMPAFARMPYPRSLKRAFRKNLVTRVLGTSLQGAVVFACLAIFAPAVMLYLSQPYRPRHTVLLLQTSNTGSPA